MRDKFALFLPIIIIILSVVIFSPSLNNFFFGDDWFHLRISNIHNLGEFINFFSFSQNAQSTTFYRPVSTQVFNFIFLRTFGLDPLPYHLFILTLFALSLWLFYRISKKILISGNQAILAIVIYGISATHFAKFYYLAASQEIIMLFFALLSILFYLRENSFKNTILSLTFFIFALLSRETAIILPGILFLIDWSKRRSSVKKVLPFIFLLVLYSIFRLAVFGGPSGDSYIWDFSIKKALNTISWYLLWALGVPELLVNYINGGINILPKFYLDFPVYAKIILTLSAFSLTSFTFILLRNFRKIDKLIIMSGGVFLVGILPVLFLPWHKFSLELTLAMMGFAIGFSRVLYKEEIKLVSSVAILFFILLNIFTIFLNFKTDYSLRRAEVSKKVFTYFRLAYPRKPEGKYFEFINDTPDYGQEWGSSRQIAQAVSGSDMFKVLYNDNSYRVFYQDFDEVKPESKQKIEISTAMFLK